MFKRLSMLAVVALMSLSLVLAACGDATSTSAPAATTAPVATTARPATTVAATTAAPATTAVATTAAPATSAAPATTAVATTAVATTAVATTAVATTAAPATTAPAAGAPTLDAAGFAPYLAIYPAPAGSAKGGNINIVSLTKQLTPDLHPYPQAVNYTASWTDISNYLFGSIFAEYDGINLVWRYAAANKIEISADGLTYKYTLRDGLKYSDGSPITAGDYTYAFEQASKKDPAGNADNEYVDIDGLSKIASYTAEGNTITCKLAEAAPKNLALGYCNLLGPVKKALWSQYPFYDNKANPEILKPTAVSGPYKLKEFKLDEKIVLEVNPNYYRGVGNLETLTFLPSAQPTNAYESVKAGQNQYAPNISASQVADAKSNAGVNYYEWAAANGTYRLVEFNLARAPFNDKAFRQAVSYAIDRAALLKAADAGLGEVTNSFVSPKDKTYYNTSLNAYAYDLSKARQVLKDAGYVESNGVLNDKAGKPVSFTVAFPTSSNPRKLQATYLQQQLKQLGIEVKVDGTEFNAYVDKVNKGDYDLSLAAYGGGFPDPTGSKGQFLSKEKGGTQNRKGYTNAKIDELWDKADKELNDAKRGESYKEIQKIINDDLPVFYLYTLSSYTATTKTVTGVKVPSLDRLDAEYTFGSWAISK